MNWTWEQFVRAEANEDDYSSADAVVFSLIRACTLENMSAIKLAINRFDGKLATPVRIQYPKVFYLFPNAASVSLEPVDQPALLEQPPGTTTDLTVTTPSEDENVLPTLGLRQTLERMVDYPRSLPQQLIDQSQEIHRWVKGQSQMKPMSNPAVKSVVAAHLIRLAGKRNMDALYELFEAVDGKLVETIQVVGEDIELISYSPVAPFGAVKNADGVYMIEATNTQKLWAQKLGDTNE